MTLDELMSRECREDRVARNVTLAESGPQIYLGSQLLAPYNVDSVGAPRAEQSRADSPKCGIFLIGPISQAPNPPG